MQVTCEDGRVSEPEPGGAMVAVHAMSPEGRRFLLLHNADLPVGAHGDWAWGSPSGCREEGERIETCAARELREETGISADPVPVRTTAIAWGVFTLEVAWGTAVRLAPDEHNDFGWFSLEEAWSVLRPERQRHSFRIAVEAISAD